MTGVTEVLELADTVRWDFPSSYGRPVARPPGEAVQSLLERRDELPGAVEALLADGDSAAATELAARAWRVWILAGDPRGGREFLRPVLEQATGPPGERARALYGDGLLAHRLGDHAASRRRNEEALAAAERAGDPEALALANLGLSRVAFDDGDADRGRELAARALELAGRVEPALTQAPLHMLAQALRLAGDLDGASARFRESLELNRRIGDEGMVGVELHNLGLVELRRGDIDDAERLLEQAAGYARPDDPYGQALTRSNAAAVAHARGDRERALALLTEADRLFAQADEEPAADDRAEIDRLRAALA